MAVRTLLYDKDDLDDGDNTATKTASTHHTMKDNAPLSHYPSYYECYSGYGCAPGLVLSDSEESSYASGCTDEFFDFEEISNTLNLIENWQKLHRKVKFASVHVQEHAITVGDHPICKDGLALSLDWAHAEEKVYNIDSYESLRQNENQSSRMKRRRRVSKLDYWQRRETLIRVGNFSAKELSRLECKRNQEAVSDFLQELGADDFGPSLLEMEDQEGIEVEQMFEGLEYEPVDDTFDDEPASSSLSDWGLGWQMNVQILED